jgi:PAS domain S-box-containing protein
MLNLPAADFFERTTDCVMVLDPDWRVVFGNEHAIRELGIGGLVGRNLWECFPEAVGSIFDERYRLAIANQASETFETFFAPLNSWYEVHAVPAGSQLTVFFRNITERHDALEAAQSRRRALDALFGQAFIGIAQFDAANRTALANDHFCRIVGRTETELAALTLADLIHPDDLADHLAALQTHRRSGEPQVAELRFLRPDGSTRWCSVNISFMRHEAEAPSTIIVAEDITERRAASANAATLLATIIDSAQDSIFVKDLRGRFVLINRALERSGLDLLGRRVEDVFPPEIAEGFAAADRHVLETGKSSVVEETVPIGGVPRTFHTIKVPWVVDGELRGLIGISRDVTRWRETEARIRRSDERYRLAAKATNDAVWDWDLVSGEVEWNAAIEHLTGERPSPRAEWWKQRIHDQDREATLDDIQGLIDKGEDRWQYEYRFRRADGSYAQILDRGYVIRDDDGKALRMIGAMSDLSERVEAQQRLNDLQNELVHVSRLSAMGTMASALAHEINQPLTGIANYMGGARRMLRERGAAAIPEAMAAIDEAAAASQHVGEIIRRLRRMVSRGKAQLQPVRLDSLVDDALALAIPNEALAAVRIDRDLGDIEAMADPVQIQQVFFNLFRNAVEAMDGQDERRLAITAHLRGDAVVVDVEDNGPGFADELRDGLFTSFGSTKAAGLGVGLTICRTIIEAHGGRISVGRSNASGSVVTFQLSAAPNPGTSAQGAGAPAITTP